MRARRSSIPLPKRHLSLLAPLWVGRPHLDPRSRSRRLVGVFASGATASRLTLCLTGRRCDGVARGPAGASAVGRGGPKGRERAVQARRPQFKSSGARAQPCAARASGASSHSPQISVRPAGGLQRRRDEHGHASFASSSLLVSLQDASTFPFFARTRARARDPRGPRGPRLVLGRPGVRLRSSRDAPNGPRASALGRGEGSLNDKLQRPPLGPPS